MISKELNHSDYNPEVEYHTEVDSTSTILTQASFSLLEERLRIELTQRKIGEIVIRKEIETELVSVQIPVRREKLIIEQVSPAYKLLAEIDGHLEFFGENITLLNDRSPAVRRRQGAR